MPLTSKGQEIMANMKNQYGSEKKAKEVFYASKNAGKIKGVDRATFIRRVGDAARAGKSAKDALEQGLPNKREAELAHGKDFFSQVRKGQRDGLSAKDTIARAVDYGVKGMRKGVRRAGDPSPQTHAYIAGRPARELSGEERLAQMRTGSPAWRQEVERQNLEKRRSRF